jgi:hypothetical protein
MDIQKARNLLSQGGGSCEEAGVWRTDGDDAGLLRAAASGDDRAFAEFYRRASMTAEASKKFR